MFLLQRGTYISVSRMWGRSPCITVTVPYDRPVTLPSDNRDVSRLITGPTHPCGISIMSHYCNKLAVYRLTLVLHYSVFVCVENVAHFPVLAVYAHCCDINVLPRSVYKPTTLIHSSSTVTYQHCLPTLLFHYKLHY